MKTMTQKSWTTVGTLLADLFFLWVIVEYGTGGWQLGLYLLTHSGIIPWLILPGVLLLLYRSDYRTDLPIFTAAVALGYWGEWRYVTGEVPPLWIDPLLGLASVVMVKLGAFIRAAATSRAGTCGL